MPIFLRTSFRSHLPSLITWPSTMIWPDVGVSNMLMQRSSVDLPVPDGPMTAMMSPLLMTAFTSFRGVVSSNSLRKCLISIMRLSSVVVRIKKAREEYDIWG